jgi:hypothetical protein
MEYTQYKVAGGETGSDVSIVGEHKKSDFVQLPLPMNYRVKREFCNSLFRPTFTI